MKCILCWLKPKGIAILLDELCPHCKVSAPASRFTDQDALKDLKNSVSTVTITLSPHWQKMPPARVRASIRHVTKKILRSRTTVPSFFEGWFEYTKADVLHLHGYIAARPTVRAELMAAFRRYGFVVVKADWDLLKWIEYCKKNQDDCSYKPINVSS